jgi:hypothetical protein
MMLKLGPIIKTLGRFSGRENGQNNLYDGIDENSQEPSGRMRFPKQAIAQIAIFIGLSEFPVKRV